MQSKIQAKFSKFQIRHMVVVLFWIVLVVVALVYLWGYIFLRPQIGALL